MLDFILTIVPVFVGVITGRFVGQKLGMTRTAITTVLFLLSRLLR
jgi:hypothetical protein